MSSSETLVEQARVIDVTIAESHTGMFFAVSKADPAVLVSATTLSKLWNAIPDALESVYSCKYCIEMKAIRAEPSDSGRHRWVVVPKHMLAQNAIRSEYLTAS
jgi:hypothetical protein